MPARFQLSREETFGSFLLKTYKPRCMHPPMQTENPSLGINAAYKLLEALLPCYREPECQQKFVTINQEYLDCTPK
jgi:hypothetical protein